MRLTLRNLLAYMDGNLEPEDADDIKKKIRESEFATKLEQHIRDVISRVRLSTPDAEGETGLDPNTVAEYLDHELPDDRVPDFEKICLESDAHLAEVVASHQILALVLGSPAEVPDSTRERMVALPEQIRGHAGPPVAPPRQPAPPAVSDDDDEVILPPELVEASRASQGGKVFLGLLAAVAVVIVLFLTGNLPWRGLEAPAEQEIAAVEGEVNKELAKAEGLPPEGPIRVTPGEPDDGAAGVPGEFPVPESPDGEKPGDPRAEGTAATSPDAVPGGTVELPAPQTDPVEAVPGTVAPGEPQPNPAESETAEGGEAVPAVEGEIKQPVSAVVPPTDAVPDEPPVAPVPQTPVGQFLTDNEFLMIWDTEENHWKRVVSNQILRSSDRLLALPPYMPKILVGKVFVTMHPGTEIMLLPGAEGDLPRDPGIEVLAGNVIIHPQVGAQPAPLVRLGPVEDTLSLDDAVSAVAAEVTRYHKKGTDPADAEPELRPRLVLLQGTIRWGARQIGGIDAANIAVDPADPEKEPIQLDGPPTWNGGEPQLFGRTISHDITDKVRGAMTEGVAKGKTVELVLAELIDDERAARDVRAVAAHALAYTGQYSRMIDLLNDERFRLNWETIGTHLREAASSDPEQAIRIHEALKGAYPQHADFLYRQLWGYTKEQLNNNDGIAILDGLNSDVLAVRVMSFQTLGKVLGRRISSYNPTQSVLQRQQWVEQERRAALSGSLWKNVDEEGLGPGEGESGSEKAADRIKRAVEGAK